MGSVSRGFYRLGMSRSLSSEPVRDPQALQRGEVIGAGTYSTVYACVMQDSEGQPQEPREPLALKVLASDRPGGVERMQHEYDVLRLMEDECTKSKLPCYTLSAKAMSLTAGGCCLVLERQGETLDKFIARECVGSNESRSLTPTCRNLALKWICYDLVSLLIQLARSDLVWSDVSSRNVLLRYDWKERLQRPSFREPLICAVDLELAGPPGQPVERPRGTPRYASILLGDPLVHPPCPESSVFPFPGPERCVTCFECDLESVVYLMIDLLTQKLPWRNAKVPGNIRAVKYLVMSHLGEYMNGLPDFISKLWTIVLDHHVLGIQRSKAQYLSELDVVRGQIERDGFGSFAPEAYSDRSSEFAEYDGLPPLFVAK